ncbi:TetR/AcrR family transcriptional regulator [Blastomonas sp.]|uniref:TetR/AcrR family transcriptional regulator n=1 Tax=Blastomonas sp. TaxID=1909299 RepID=UPI00391B204D
MMLFVSNDGVARAATAGAATQDASVHPTRLRLLQVATRLFQQRGYHAVGLAEILALAEAPKGSLYHHFPGGKPELAEACITRIAASTLSALDEASGSGADIIGFLRQLGAESCAWLERTDWRDGSLLAVIGQEQGGGDTALADAVRIAYQRIEMRLAKWLMLEGVAVARARDIAATIIAAHEGAMLLARCRRDTAPVTLTTDMLCAMVDRG